MSLQGFTGTKELQLKFDYCVDTNCVKSRCDKKLNVNCVRSLLLTFLMNNGHNDFDLEFRELLKILLIGQWMSTVHDTQWFDVVDVPQLDLCDKLGERSKWRLLQNEPSHLQQVPGWIWVIRQSQFDHTDSLRGEYLLNINGRLYQLWFHISKYQKRLRCPKYIPIACT